jgi:hypothetical protein
MEGMTPTLHVADARASIEWCAKLGFEVKSEHFFGSELLVTRAIQLKRAILDALRCNFPLDPSDLIGRCGHHSAEDVRGAK